MRVLRIVLFLVYLSVPLSAGAGVSNGDFPANTVWYLHADLEQMRTAAAGRGLYEWLNAEVFVEIHEKVGIDFGPDTDMVTAFSDSDRGTVLIIQGPVTRNARDELLELARDEGDLDRRSYDGKEYFHLSQGASIGKQDRDALDELEESSFFSFAVGNKIIVTSDERQMEVLLDSNGSVTGSPDHSSALFVLTADRELVQAGVRTDELADDDGDWGSNIIRNTKQAALLVAAQDGLIALEAQLVTEDPAIAQSIGGIVNGIIALQAFNDDLDPGIVGIIQNTKIEVQDNALSINTVVDPDLLASVLSD